MFVKRFIFCLIALCLMMLPLSATAKDKNEGSVSGKVHKNSASGAPLSGVKVKCGGESDKTDDDGKFKIKGIKTGNQTISFSKEGYESYQTTVRIVDEKTANIGDRWLTKEKETGSVTATTAKCPSGNGLYCGDSGKGQNAAYLYQCTSGSYSLKSTCNNGCQKNAAGKDDSCKASPSPASTPAPAPIKASCPSGNGLYCGDSGKGQNTGYLYQCTSGAYSLKSTCNSGCQKNAAGKDDSCKASPSSASTPVPIKASCPSGNGLYCGDSGKGQNTGYLYQCTSGSYSLKSTCNSGCQKNAAGKDDSCKTSPIPTPIISGNTRTINDYPYRNDNISGCTSTCYADVWGFCKKNCTSYVAWRINGTISNNSFTNTMNGGKWGNACNWDDNASRLGLTVNNIPSVGAIAQWNEKEVAGGYGHVAYVEKVNSDGTVNVSEYNFSNKCGYGERSNRSAPRYIHINPSVNTGASVSQSVGSISGKLHKNSASGVALPDVDVKCDGISSKTNQYGEFLIKNVLFGNQTISFSKQGYESYSTTVMIKTRQKANMGDRWLTENINTLQGDSTKSWKTQLDVMAINQNDSKYTWHENGYTFAAGCVPASLAMLIDYKVRQSGYGKINFDMVLMQLREQYRAHNNISTTEKITNFFLPITVPLLQAGSHFYPRETDVNMDSEFLDKVRLNLGNGYNARINWRKYPKIIELNKFLGAVKENLDAKRPVAVRTGVVKKNYIDLVGNELKFNRDPNDNHTWVGGHEMVITGYETNTKCTNNSYNICRLIINDTNSTAPKYFDVYKIFWNNNIGVAFSFKGDPDVYVYVVSGSELDLIAILGLEFLH